MTQTCKSCHEDSEFCRYVGTDRRECEHPVRLSDVETLPVVETPSSLYTTACPCRECDAIKTRLHNVEQQVHDIGRAVRGELP